MFFESQCTYAVLLMLIVMIFINLKCGQCRHKHKDVTQFQMNAKCSKRRSKQVFKMSFTSFHTKAKAKAYNTCRAPQAATATSEALVMSQAKLA